MKCHNTPSSRDAEENQEDLIRSINDHICIRLLRDVFHLPIVLSSLLQARIRELCYPQHEGEPLLLLCSDFKAFYLRHFHSRSESSALFSIVLHPSLPHP